MIDWNVVVTTQPQGFRTVVRRLGRLGGIETTAYWNVLVMRVPEVRSFPEQLQALTAEDPALAQALSRVVPVMEKFRFQSREGFDRQLRDRSLALVPTLRDKSFHVRMHRRGFKGVLSSQAEERTVAELILAGLSAENAAARVAFADPDFVVALETVDDQAGISLWSRDELRRYRWLRLDGS
jgi:tRNA(Ser,Leu) C12 N-acetylase TAN1